MTKFEDLCNSYSLSRKKYFNYRNECVNFADKLVSGMFDYFKCPKEQIKYFSPKDQYMPDNHSYQSLRGVMTLEDDTFWHFGIGLTLYESPDIKPCETITIHILLKKICEHFTVKINTFDEKFVIHANKPADFEKFYEFIFNEIKEDYEKDFEVFFKEKDRVRKIGFK
ncbi:MAG: hypothetical protein L3J17_08555 [Candidatus Jettenia sp.]|nr:MAG: hypothetical protein L3J17_08555 [Candidatus Jettenia sp.]